jgi:Zn-finger nucleic acid-binding protein
MYRKVMECPNCHVLMIQTKDYDHDTSEPIIFPSHCPVCSTELESWNDVEELTKLIESQE